MASIHNAQILMFICMTGVCSISLLDAYKSEKFVRRRQGMQNVRFRPLAHLRGDDDWRKQIGFESLSNQMMDENGIVYDINPTLNEKISSFFNTYRPNVGIGPR